MIKKRFWFDLKTTGTNPAKHGIHQIAGCIEIDGDVKEWFDFKVQPNPKAQIEAAALEIGNVKLEDIQAYPPMGEVYVALLKILAKYVNKFDKTDKFQLCGYNNRGFDDNFLRGLFLQNEDKYFGSWFWADSVDVLVIASDFLADQRHLLENFQLRTVARFLGIWVDKLSLHDGRYDIEITKKIYKEIDVLRSKRIIEIWEKNDRPTE